MEKNTNHIDDLFREQLGDHEQKPPIRVWEGIENQLQKRKKKRTIFFFQNIAAAILVLLTIGGIYLYSTDKSNNNTIEVTAKNKDSQNIQINKPDNKISNTKTLTNIEKNITIPNTIPDISNPTKTKISKYKKHITPSENKSQLDIKNEFMAFLNEDFIIKPLESKKALIESKDETPDKTTIFNQPAQVFSHEQILAMHSDQIDSDKSKKNKWVIGGQFSPTYTYRNVVDNSSAQYDDFEEIDYNSSEKPIISYSGGFNIKYETNSRIVVQSGIHYSKVGQNLDNVPVYQNVNRLNKVSSTVVAGNSLGNIESISPSYQIDNSSFAAENTAVYYDQKSTEITATNNETEIEQNLEYIEIPLILKYKIIDSKIDFVVLGGLSTNFLIGNNVYMKENGTKNQIGETANIKNLNYSSIIGLGIDYNFASKFSLSIEPALKYHISPVNNNNRTEVHPYTFGIYTGLNYSF